MDRYQPYPGGQVGGGKTHTGVQLIDAADPFQVGFGQVVKGHEVVVTG